MKASITVKVRPGAGKTRIREIREDGMILMDVDAPPEKGKANQEVLRFLARVLGVHPSDLHLVPSTRTRREKVIQVSGLSAKTLLRRIQQAVSPTS